MRVLFVPNQGGPVSHGIPLLALSELLPGERFTKAFLVPQQAHAFFKLVGANVLELNHEGLRTEMIAYRRFRPDIVVDDFSLSTAIASPLVGLPRVTIQRTGTFPGGLPRNAKHIFSGEFDLASFLDLTKFDRQQPTSFADLLRADATIVPGIESIETLPAQLSGTTSYFYSGPLLTKDLYCPDDGQISLEFPVVEDFFATHRARNVLYVTFGNIARPHSQLRSVILQLLTADQPVISNINLNHEDYPVHLYLSAAYLPMHYICSRAKLIVHHCGSGTYHYPLLHGKPFITVGTGTYDRDDVAMRLQDLGVGPYIPGPGECPDFEARLTETILDYLNGDMLYLPNTMQALADVKLEITRTANAFSFEKVLHFAADNCHLNKTTL